MAGEESVTTGRMARANQTFARLAIWLCLGLAAVAGVPGQASAAGRVALVIGNANYVNTTRLNNSIADTRIIGNALRQAHFEVETLNDASLDNFRTALSGFRLKAQGADVALVYYAGHGIEANGRNWLLPVGVKLSSDYDLSFEAVELDQVLGALAGARVRMVVLDACRNNPFGQNWKSATRAVTRGLGRVEIDDVLVMYAAAAGDTASDGKDGNSPFALSLSQRLVEPGLLLQLLPGKVRDDVSRATGGTQRPYVNASITGEEIYLVPKSEPAAPPGPAPARPAQQLAPATATQRPPEDEARLTRECDRLAGSELDPDRPADAPFVAWDDIVPAAAIPACTRAVEATPASARMKALLGNVYLKAEDFASARRWSEAAVAQGNTVAMVNLGIMLGKGQGAAADPVGARALLERAAARGNADGMVWLGYASRYGWGGAPNLEESRRWNRLAAEKGSVEAMIELAYVHFHGQGIARDYAEARRWFEQAAAKGNVSAMYHLGKIHETGLGVAANLAEARRWYRQAAAKNDGLAQRWLAGHPD